MKKSASRLAVAGFVALGLSGCVVNVGDSWPDRAEAVPPPPAVNGGQMTCNAAPAQYHIGHSATQSMGEAILKDAVSALNEGVWRPPGGGATASAFEKEAQRQLQVSAAAYGVENKIILHAGRKFPDIVFENSKF